MKELGTEFSSFPGDPPRNSTFKRLLSCLSGNLQIMVTVFPLGFLGSLAWLLTSFQKESFTGFFTCVIMLPVYLIMIIKEKTDLQRRPVVAGSIENITQGEGPFAGCKVIHFSYRVADSIFCGEHLTSDPKGAKVGQNLWVLFNEKKPQDAVPWIN